MRVIKTNTYLMTYFGESDKEFILPINNKKVSFDKYTDNITKLLTRKGSVKKDATLITEEMTRYYRSTGLKVSYSLINQILADFEKDLISGTNRDTFKFDLKKGYIGSSFRLFIYRSVEMLNDYLMNLGYVKGKNKGLFLVNQIPLGEVTHRKFLGTFKTSKARDNYINSFLLRHGYIEQISDHEYYSEGNPLNLASCYHLKPWVINLLEKSDDYIYLERPDQDVNQVIKMLNDLDYSKIFELATFTLMRLPGELIDLCNERISLGVDEKYDEQLNLSYIQARLFLSINNDLFGVIIKKKDLVSKRTGRFYFIYSCLPSKWALSLENVLGKKMVDWDISDTSNTVLLMDRLGQGDIDTFVNEDFSLLWFTALKYGKGKEVLALAMDGDYISKDGEIVSFQDVADWVSASKVRNHVKSINYQGGFGRFGNAPDLFMRAIRKIDKGQSDYLWSLRKVPFWNLRGKKSCITAVKAQQLEVKFKETVQKMFLDIVSSDNYRDTDRMMLTKHDCFKVSKDNEEALFTAISFAAKLLKYKFIPYLKLETLDPSEKIRTSIDFYNSDAGLYRNNLRHFEQLEEEIFVASRKFNLAELTEGTEQNKIFTQLISSIKESFPTEGCRLEKFYNSCKIIPKEVVEATNKAEELEGLQKEAEIQDTVSSGRKPASIDEFFTWETCIKDFISTLTDQRDISQFENYLQKVNNFILQIKQRMNKSISFSQFFDFMPVMRESLCTPLIDQFGERIKIYLNN